MVQTLVARIEIADDGVTVVYRVPSAPTSSSTVIPESEPDTPDFVGCVPGIPRPRVATQMRGLRSRSW